MNDSDLIEEISYSSDSIDNEEVPSQLKNTTTNTTTNTVKTKKKNKNPSMITINDTLRINCSEYIKLKTTLFLDEVDSGESNYTDDDDAVISDSD